MFPLPARGAWESALVLPTVIHTPLKVMNSHLSLRLPPLLAVSAAVLLATPSVSSAQARTGPPRVIAWNDLGMHCMDPDFSVFAILPPFNDLNAQLLINGALQNAPGGYTLTYEAVADANGSITTTSIGKSNFWDHVDELFGVMLPLDVGLAGFAMPGPSNVPQTMGFDSTWSWFDAVGIPVFPIDDAFQKQTYPLMKVTARDSGGNIVASTVTVVPNSQELQCSECHASGQNPFARPSAGWVYDPDPLRDDRLNIVRLHDEMQATDPTFVAALATAGYLPGGLEATVESGTAILCDACHSSNALPGTGIAGIEPLTQAIHGLHAGVQNPANQTLGEVPDRSACYSCHPGFETQCLRGAMGRAIGSDGNFRMHCQSCHGSMSDVGAPTRTGWLEEPACQECHTGSATNNNGQIRYTSVFEANGTPRVPVSNLFATTPNVPAPGSSLYRFSDGHGGLQCSACHGSPHAIVPTSFPNDNVQNIALQGHEGTLVDCNVCHTGLGSNEVQGPHGMHPVDQNWVKDQHGDIAEHNTAACFACHGSNARGTELSRAQGDRVFSTKYGTKNFWRGFQVSCYACHDGPNSEKASKNTPPSVSNRTMTVPNDTPTTLTLTGSDPDGNTLSWRIISQPKHGTVGLVGNTVTFYPQAGYLGADSFTFAAWDGKANSNLGTVQVNLSAPNCPGGIEPYGFGCIGSGGFLPQLSVTGCPTPGGQVTFHVTGALGGASAWLLAGSARSNLEPLEGCVQRVSPLVFQIAGLQATGSGAGQGSFDFTATIPSNYAPGTLDFQVLLRDPGAASGWAATNGVELDIR